MLAGDPNFVPLNHVLDEEPVGEVMSFQAQRVDSGDVIASPLPDDSWRESYKFNGVSNSAAYLDNKLQNLLSRYYSGAELRVYRDFHTSTAILDHSTNPAGYSDMLMLEPTDYTFDWFGSTLSRFVFEIEGVEVR